MTNLMKLSVIALLTGALGLVGCGDGGGGTAGTGGSGAAGGSGGSGGSGGGEPCEQTCGVGNTVNAEWAADQQVLNCEVMGIALGLGFNFIANPTAALASGENTYDLQAEAVIDSATATLITNLADQSEIQSTEAIVNPTAGTTDPTGGTIDLDGVPCTVCWEAGVEVRVPTPVVQDTWDLNDGGTQTLELTDVTILINAAGLDLELSTSGDDPMCAWDTIPPSLSFSLP